MARLPVDALAEELRKTDMLLEYAEKIVGKSVALVRNGL